MKIIEITHYSDVLLNAVNILLPQLTSHKKPVTKNSLSTIIHNRNTTLFVAEQDNQYLGMLSLVTVLIPTGIRCIIEDVVVDKRIRGLGAGRALMESAIQKAQKLGCEDIRLTSSPSRIEANALYVKLGFEIRETNVYRKSLS